MFTESEALNYALSHPPDGIDTSPPLTVERIPWEPGMDRESIVITGWRVAHVCRHHAGMSLMAIDDSEEFKRFARRSPVEMAFQPIGFTSRRQTSTRLVGIGQCPDCRLIVVAVGPERYHERIQT